DEQCLAGRFVWTRLAARRAEPGRGAAPVRSTPIVLLARRNLRLWSSLAGTVEVQNLSPPAQRVAEYLSSHGASFFDEIAPGSSPSTWCGRCCAAGAWCSGGCSRARPSGCRRGATC